MKKIDHLLVFVFVFVFVILIFSSCSSDNTGALYSEKYIEVDNKAYHFSDIIPPVKSNDDNSIFYNFNAYSDSVKRPDDYHYILNCMESTDYFPLSESDANEIFYNENRSPFASLIGKSIVLEIYNPSWDGDNVPKREYAFADIVMEDNHLYLGVFHYIKDNVWNLTVYRPEDESVIFSLIE